MSGKTIARLLDKAFNKVGKIAGHKFTVYRPVSWMNPLSDANYVGDIDLAASVDDGFSAQAKELDKFKLFTSASGIEAGDILYNEGLDQTYVVMEKIEMRSPIGVLAKERINLFRSQLGVGVTTLNQIGAEIPAAVKVSGAAQSSGVNPQGSLTNGQTELELWTSLPAGFIALNDIVELNGNRYAVTFAQNTAKGTNLKMRSTKVGK